MSEPTRPLISIVVPVFNEEENILPMHDAVTTVMRGLVDRYDYEMVFTDNHSTDRSFAILEALARADQHVRVLRFSRNFGFERSLWTGYAHARGAAAIQLDCDLQDPPELIPEFLRQWEAGFQVVYGVRQSRQESWWLTLGRKVFYRVVKALSGDDLPLDAGECRLVDRRVLEELRWIDDYQPYVRGTIAALGFEQIGVPYHRAPRTRGTSKFSLADLVKLSVDAVLNHSVVPLRLATYIGLAASIATFLGMLGYLAAKLWFERDWPAGFATTTVLLLVSITLNALFLGIIGEYLGRIHQQVRRRPITVIERTVNLSPRTPRREAERAPGEPDRAS